LADAPIDGANNVWIEIPGLQLQSATSSSEGWQDYPIEPPLQVDLLTLQSGGTISLIDGVVVEPGEYNIRLMLNQAGNKDSYIVLDDGTEHELTIPSGAQTGLKLNSRLTIPANGAADYTIDFDARRSIVQRGNANSPNLEYALKPVLRLVNNTEVGSISGEIDPAIVDLVDGCSDSDPLTHNVVYVFEGHGVMPDDYGSSGAQAVTSALVTFDENSGVYRFKASFLLVGDYTTSFTCNADLEDTEADDELLFQHTQNVVVTLGG
jgi:hypothetical protein